MISKRDIKRLRSMLAKSKKRLEKELKKLGSVDFGDDIDSDEDEADEVEQKISNLATIDILKNRLDSVNAAIKKIDDGTYGKCEKCGKEISIELLNIDPESKLCQNCKRANG